MIDGGRAAPAAFAKPALGETGYDKHQQVQAGRCGVRRARRGRAHPMTGRTDPAGAPKGYRLSVRRLFLLPLGLSAFLVLALLAGLVAVSLRGVAGIRPIQDHLAHIARIQDLGLTLEQTLLQGLRGTRIEPADLDRMRLELTAIAALDGHLHPATRERLDLAVQRLSSAGDAPLEALIATLTELRAVLGGERERHDRLIADLALDNETELRLALTLMVTLPLGGAALAFLLRRRIKDPLDDLGDLLGRLAARDYRPVAEATLSGSTGLVQPVFRSYNELVMRLKALEAEHQGREHTLEQEVRRATEALLAQNRELARAERLAAVGAVSAGLAHELRNPLAGIQMACTKLRQALEDSDQAGRLDAVLAEIKRINGLLTAHVEAARHEPEPLAAIRLDALVADLLALTRYQAPAGIVLRARIPADLECLLPAAGLRQALLNLLINAIGAIGAPGAGGQIEVSAERRGDALLLCVEDDGPGFAEETLIAGVRPFATARSGGTGLGLAMVRTFTRDHGGDLELVNREPHGARVTLRLPCARARSNTTTRATDA
jgi:signal transduction histidine kinase